jgi:hypothetical protein
MQNYPKIFLKIIFVSLFFYGFSLAQTKDTPEKLAQTVAEAWMPLWDSGKYDESYEELAESTKKNINKRTWFVYWTGVRKPLGKLKSRNLIKAEFIKSLEGMPDQEGVILQYESSFEKRDSVLETFGLIHEKNGTWRVGHYLTDQN